MSDLHGQEREALDAEDKIRELIRRKTNLSGPVLYQLAAQCFLAVRGHTVQDTERPDRRLADPISGEEIAQGRGEFRIADSPAQERAGERLKHERGSIRAAFDGLGLGWDYEDVWDYCNGSVSFRTLPRDRRGIVAGMLMGFAIVVAERVRDTEQK